MLFYRDTTRLRQRTLFHTLLTVLLSTTLSHAMMPEEPDGPHSLPLQPSIFFLQDQELVNSLGKFKGVPLDVTQRILKQDRRTAKRMFPVSKGFYTLLYGEVVVGDPIMEISSWQMMEKALDPRNPRKPYIKHLTIASDTSFWTESTVLLPKGLLPQYPHLISLKIGKMNNREDCDVVCPKLMLMPGFFGLFPYPIKPDLPQIPLSFRHFFTLDHTDISEYLIKTTSLQTLSLRNHQFLDEFSLEEKQNISSGPGHEIFSALQHNTTLTSLDFSHNAIWDIALTWLTRDLRFNNGLKLRTLNLRTLLIGETLRGSRFFLDGFIEGIPDTLKCLPSLTELDFEETTFDQQTQKTLQTIKENNPSLQLKWSS